MRSFCSSFVIELVRSFCLDVGISCAVRSLVCDLLIYFANSVFTDFVRSFVICSSAYFVMSFVRYFVLSSGRHWLIVLVISLFRSVIISLFRPFCLYVLLCIRLSFFISIVISLVR